MPRQWKLLPPPQPKACHLLMGFLTPHSSLWFHKESSSWFHLGLPVVFLPQSIIFSCLGFLSKCKPLHAFFYKLDLRSETLSPAALNICSESYYLFFFPHLLSHRLFPTPKLLDKMRLAKLVCILWKPTVFYILQCPTTQRTEFYAYCDPPIICWEKKWKDGCFLFITLVSDIQQMWSSLY